MNDTILAIIFFLLAAWGLYEIAERSDRNLRPASKPICSIEFKELNPDCVQIRKEEISDI